jgi:hypothetical protein
MILTVIPELLLDSPGAKIWQKADLHRLCNALLWLLYVPSINPEFTFVCVEAC